MEKEKIKEIEIEATEDGPYLIKINGKVETALCRCGGSQSKPYCDGTHRKINFKAEKEVIKLL
ncbi:MAG: CDGSH iron-sulfur domain-containing protein [Candidatus Aenigmatarchaeota archaeon]